MGEKLQTQKVREYVKKYITDNLNPLKKHALAKIIKAQEAKMFISYDIERIRSIIRKVTGNRGDELRERVTDKTLYESILNELPETHKEPYDFYYLDKKYNNILSISDLHIPYQDDEAIASALEYGLQHEVNCIILLGDVMDLYQLSKFTKDPQKPHLSTEIKLTKEFFTTLRKNFPTQKIVYLISNHELRLPYYLRNNAPELVDLDALTFQSILETDKFNIEVLKPFQLIKAGHLTMLHGHEVRLAGINVNPARSLFLKLKDNGLCGHSHRVSEHIESKLIDQYIGCYSQGCLCELHPDYAPVNNWCLGFSHIKTHENGMFSIYNKKIINGMVL